MKRIISALVLVFVLVSMFTVMASAEEVAAPPLGTQVAKAIYGTPEIDGYADSIWDSAEIHYLNYEFENDGITPRNTVRFRSMWDENYVYFLVDVKDETMYDEAWEKLIYNANAGHLWKRDSMSYVFSPNYNRDETVTQEAPAFWFIIGAFGSTANFNSSWVDNKVWISEDEGATKMFAISYYTDVATNVHYGYTIECKINLKLMHEAIEMKAGTKIGFDMYNNNNNNVLMSASRNYGLTWGGTTNSYKNDAEKGTVEFMEPGVKFENSAEDLAWDITFPEPSDTTPVEDEPDVTTPVEDEPDVTTPADEPEVTTPADEPEVTTPVDEPDVTTPADDDKEPSGGCGSVAAASAIVLAVAVLGGAVVLNKKEK